MKNFNKLFCIVALLFLSFGLNAQSNNELMDPPLEGGGSTTTTYFNSSISKIINSCFSVSFQTQAGVYSPINLQVLPVASTSYEVHIMGVSIVSFTTLSYMYELTLEVLIDIDSTQATSPTVLTPLDITSYRYVVTIRTNGTYSYTYEVI
jgi:hypothetical protein